MLFGDDTIVFCEIFQNKMIHLSWLTYELVCRVEELMSSYLGLQLGASFKLVVTCDQESKRFF